jgi:hypothetical protein
MPDGRHGNGVDLGHELFSLLFWNSDLSGHNNV